MVEAEEDSTLVRAVEKFIQARSARSAARFAGRSSNRSVLDWLWICALRTALDGLLDGNDVHARAFRPAGRS